ncbi:antitoxin YezG family protein [Aneurinibacillus thermoaerophilus]|uniref:Antitoxin YezG family protein n=1 Tax=Aneurinibacillus thermoaerophilus TaxID=143495 RepID=A0ABX8YE89_ANETH|nr:MULTISPECIES: antitoxin YezG family protein [Aneurinibacillus]AMA73476.1 cytoplasmic protein [Aneurinibacillus sp. XH2]MED0759170.1 antitoxin YezG family protein [Aneurinibacillus thermoaerophilus]MED0762733.1 antitoxin YezG family protein [Aneurinibacillus thermoaerophilus]QYY43949.1 antitoxin YezG family protein [Aneurinibacillus thermoaerophilus]
MDEAKLGSIYQAIAQNIIETIPEDWDKVYLYAELTEGVRKSYFFYYPVESDEPVYSHDIPELFDINENEYDQLWYQLLDLLKELWDEFKVNSNQPWSNLTLILDNEGNFKIDYSYNDLSKADPHEQQIIWEHKYLGLIPEDDDDREFLEEYLKSIEDKTE